MNNNKLITQFFGVGVLVFSLFVLPAFSQTELYSNKDSQIFPSLLAQKEKSASDKNTQKVKVTKKGVKVPVKNKELKKDEKSEDTGVDFVDSEDGYINARRVNEPAFRTDQSVNSVMFQNRPRPNNVELKKDPAQVLKDVEVTGGHPTVTTVNGKEFEKTDKSFEDEEKDTANNKKSK